MWYSKPIASGRMLNFRSFHQMKHKINVAYNFIHRVYALTSTGDLATLASTIHNHLQLNNYPRSFINRLINNYHHKKAQEHINPPSSVNTDPNAQAANLPIAISSHNQPPSIDQTHSNSDTSITRHRTESGFPDETESNSHDNAQTNDSETSKTYMSIPYVPRLTDNIIKVLKPQLPNVLITSKQLRTIFEFHTNMKDPVSKNEKSNIIYKIPCSECQSCYIGMTQNKLKTRLSGHRSDVNKLDRLQELCNTNTTNNIDTLREKTALISHCIDHNHRFNFDNTQILEECRSYSGLSFIEMCHIVNTSHAVNKRSDVEGLHNTYASILHTIKNKIHTTPSQ